MTIKRPGVRPEVMLLEYHRRRSSMATSRRQRLLERAAVHEAGHAVVAYVLGIRIDEISIEPVGTSGGRVSGRLYAHQRSPELALAGYAAEEVLEGVEAVWELYDLPESDLHAAIEILSARHGGTITPKDVEFVAAWERAKRAVGLASRRVRALARLLLDDRTIEGADRVKRLVGGRGVKWYNRTLMALHARHPGKP